MVCIRAIYLFDSIGNGWKGDVTTNGDPQHEIDLITQSNFTYSLDTLVAGSILEIIQEFIQ